ncbi:MAG: hypothetical protein ACRC8C_01105, partial [Mycoplasmoidaceae bacterium]
KTPNTALPNLTIDFTLHESVYQNSDESLKKPIIINLSDSTTGSIKYNFTYNSDFGVNLRKHLNDSLIPLTWQQMEIEYNEWNRFEGLPQNVQDFIKSNIIFDAVGLKEGDINIPGGGLLNNFDSVIDDIVLNIGQFPDIHNGVIPPINLTLSMNSGAFYFDNSNNFQTSIIIDSGNLINANGIVEIILDNNNPTYINNLQNGIQSLISEDLFITNKTTYDRWKSIDDFPPKVMELIEEIPIDSNGYPNGGIKLTGKDIVQNAILNATKPFPSETGMTIDPLTITVNLKDNFQIVGGGKSFTITLDGLQSLGKYEIDFTPKIPTNKIVDLFTDKINSVLRSGTTSQSNIAENFYKMQSNYNSLVPGKDGINAITKSLNDDMIFTNYTFDNSQINFDVIKNFLEIKIELGNPAPDAYNNFGAVTIKMKFKPESKYTWKTLKSSEWYEIKTNNLFSAQNVSGAQPGTY